MTDSGQVRLNHYLHMKPDLVGPNSDRVQMACEDCHRLAGVQDHFPYASDLFQTTASGAPSAQKLSLASATMAPVKFANHCAGCHTLQFDARFAGQQVPHDKPEVIHAFLVKRFQEFIATNPAAVHQIEPPGRQVPRTDRPLRIARNASDWVQFRVDDAEWLLWAKTCKQCHAIKSAGIALPEIVPSQIRSRWLEHATFDHHAHRMMTCISCHAKAIESHDTADVLLPGIDTCRECHHDQARSREVAEGRCFECHQYHDWSKARRTKGRFSIPEIRGTAQLLPPQN
jgi:hypothetical protein